MKFEEFKTKVESAGLEARKRSDEHWQIRGGPNLVNFYPHSKRGPRFYVAGTRGALGAWTDPIAEAIRAANEAPPPSIGRGKRGHVSRYRRWKRAQCRKNPHCHWCKCKVSYVPKEDVPLATVDHRIPLFRGGLDHSNNWVLACEPCNRRRGRNMPELKKRKGA